MRALLLLALVGAAVAAAATTTSEPDRPVWPQEYQVRGGPCCRRRHPPAYPTLPPLQVPLPGLAGHSPGAAEGGQYRLCWCSPVHLHNDSIADAGTNSVDCNLAPSDSILADVGSLFLLGPAPLLQHRTCTSRTALSAPDFHTKPRKLQHQTRNGTNSTPSTSSISSVTHGLS